MKITSEVISKTALDMIRESIDSMLIAQEMGTNTGFFNDTKYMVGVIDGISDMASKMERLVSKS